MFFSFFFFFFFSSGERRDGIDFRIGSDLSRILMDETDSIVSSAMANMPGNRGHESILSSGGRIMPYTGGLDASDLLVSSWTTFFRMFYDYFNFIYHV